MGTKIRILALITLIGMPLLAWVLSYFFNLDFDLIGWFFPQNLLIQLGVGIVYGFLVAVLASWITDRKFMSSVRSRYHQLFYKLELTWFDVFLISISAGIGEEILFRFAVQSLIGVWLAALIFVLIHGYLNPKDWRISVYGTFMTVAAAGFGYLTIHYGLLSAMVAHAVVDIYLLTQFKLEKKKATFDFIDHDRNQAD